MEAKEPLSGMEMLDTMIKNLGLSSRRIEKKSSGRRNDSDEYYVISLCNEALGIEGQQQYRLPFLLGDSGTRLPVDAYYSSLKLVIEYYERQHTESVKLFDKRMTVSGVNRGEQRRIYDERRRVELFQVYPICVSLIYILYL